MGDCGEDFKAFGEYKKQQKEERKNSNLSHMQSCGLIYTADASGSLHFKTRKGKVVFYPSTGRFQHGSGVFRGGALACEIYVREMDG